MNTRESEVEDNTRSARFRGLARIVRFNWPQYVVAAVGIVTGVVAIGVLTLPAVLLWLMIAGVTLATWWLAASLVASWWVYDKSPLTRWTWVNLHTGRTAGCGHLLNIHCGYDDSTPRLRSLFPQARVDAIDLHDPQRMSEPSLRRARRMTRPVDNTLKAIPGQLPIGDGIADAVFLLFAVHEIRSSKDREALFREVRRVLRPGGRVVLVEHGRDLWNFLAFGPGVFHFLPVREWLRIALLVNLRVHCRSQVTPFVRILVLEN